MVIGGDVSKTVKDIGECSKISNRLSVGNGYSQFRGGFRGGWRSSWNRRRGRGRGGRGRGSASRSIDKSESKKLPLDSQQVQELDVVSINTNDFQAGRLKLFVNEWRKLTSDKYILDAVQHCYIEFTDNRPPIQNKMSIRNSKFNLKEEKIVDIEIEKLLKMNVIQEVESEINEFISPIFVRPKKNGEYRMILNLKELNKHIEYQHFKMDSFESALNLIKENAYMSSVDLRHAYYSVNIAEQHRKYLRFVWKEKYFQYSCLPNGIAMAPRLFTTKIMKVVYAKFA
ncbi:Hypothetical predicted protein [Mytilus galloprovincialis]|uniref:Reverse transcriptase domain-containing protein n=1 Tax=Mytilus galloprovincialis TaxID=29158 RepID=A0A8B6H015_MYTGA|nr:Hypothetical predicted protein [Mytilus galloprovincialis]